MKMSMVIRCLSVSVLSLSFLSGYAQAKVYASDYVQIDTLTKVIGALLTVGGFFMGFMQLKMANKIAEVEAKFNVALGLVKKDFAEIIDKETEKLETKIQLSGTTIESRMATRHDIENIKTIIKLQHDLTTEQIKSLEKQLNTAARIYKEDRQ